MPRILKSPHWSSQTAVYLGTIGAAVGLGSIWRFPYLAGTFGGGAFISAFVLACVFIAAPVLVAEYLIGRYAGGPPVTAAGVLARDIGASPRWNLIGELGTVAAFLLGSYYTIIAGWVLAYAWKCGRGLLVGLTRPQVQAAWHAFLADPWQLLAWQALFLCLAALISGRGVGPGIEMASRIRAPALLVLLVLLDGYALTTGDVTATLRFAVAPHWQSLSAGVFLAAIGQAFFATGIGQGMMIAYGSYMQRDASLVRPALWVVVSILLASLLATLLVFPLVFRFHMDPAGGPPLVFDVLPTAFAAMPGGRLIGTVFFVLLILAALTPTLAIFEPVVAWLTSRGLRRGPAALVTAVAMGLAGVVSVLSFNVGATWRPFDAMPAMHGKTVFEGMDFLCGDVFLPVVALLTCLFTGWRLDRATFDAELRGGDAFARATCRFLLHYVCPLAIAAVLVATFFPHTIR